MVILEGNHGKGTNENKENQRLNLNQSHQK